MWSKLIPFKPTTLVGLVQRRTSTDGQSTGHPPGGYRFWKKMTLLVALPSVGLCFTNVYLAHQHDKHHHVRPKFVQYEYLRIRNKRFPWGDGVKSLFHNPEVNALPNGYEK